MSRLDLEQILVDKEPDPKIRKRYLEVFAEALLEANSYGANKWGVYADLKKIRLLVGSIIVLTIDKRGLWMALDRPMLDEPQAQRDFIENSSEWQWDIGLYEEPYPEYERPPSKNGYYTPVKSLKLWPRLKKLHFAYIGNVAKKYGQLLSRSQARHTPELLTYLRHELKCFIPSPIYGDEIESLPEEVEENDALLFEGKLQTIKVNYYERNAKARETCLAHYQKICAVCGVDLAEIYGEVGNGLIHVHHLKPLADIRKKYQVNPINDLRPVCPNCHAVLHRKKPPYTIEQVKQFMAEAKKSKLELT